MREPLGLWWAPTAAGPSRCSHGHLHPSIWLSGQTDLALTQEMFKAKCPRGSQSHRWPLGVFTVRPRASGLPSLLASVW